MTVLDLIKLALKQAGVLGVGQSLSAEDSTDVFNVLNMMIGQWAVKRWLIYGLQDVSVVSTGAENYTYGTGGNFNYSPTDKLEGAYFRYLQNSSNLQTDFPLEIINSYEDYGMIRLKNLSTWPIYVFFDNAFPLANVKFWPVPQASLFELHLLTKQVISQFTGLSQTINLPLQYQEPLLYNLGVRIRPMYQLPNDPQLTALAAASLETLRNSNAQVGRLHMPQELRTTGGWYNPISDRTN